MLNSGFKGAFIPYDMDKNVGKMNIEILCSYERAIFNLSIPKFSGTNSYSKYHKIK